MHVIIDPLLADVKLFGLKLELTIPVLLNSVATTAIRKNSN